MATSKSSLLSATLASGSSLVLLQLFSRIITFVLNQALVRLVSPQVFGTTSIQFELLLSTILFLSREGVRNALLRAQTNTQHSPDEATARRLITNVSLLPVLLGVPTAAFSAFAYLVMSSSITSSQPHFRTSVVLYALAAFSELLSEPMYIRTQNELRFQVRVRAEGTAVVLKTVTTFLVLVRAPEDWALVAFALGQTAYGLTMLLSFTVACRDNLDFRPKRVTVTKADRTDSLFFEPALFRLSVAMTGQSVVKHFLTEGDKFLVSRLSPLADQGGYAVAANYGSLIARIVFQPIEETARVFFSKTLPSPSSDSKAKEQKDALRTAATVLLTLLLAFTHLLLLAVTFGPPYLSLAISLVLPRKYLATSAPAILHVYVYYIPMMAFNGVLEAFFASAASPADLRAQSRWMLVFSGVFIAAAVGLARGLGMGDAGLVWANVANLTLRAAYAWAFVRRFFRERGAADAVGWRRAVPPMPVLAVFAGAGALVRGSSAAYAHVPLNLIAQKGHLATGVACILGCLLTCVVFERKTVMQLVASLRNAR
ncbi:Rft-1-domain-containing protein [Trametes versicolor FP-101664 SS1]|uniref:Rft-1-domain-containing protein n=1 Tax=Trametes versicolor (strain FP-101664) TaxID=717944 RepID=UPI0004623425|nr:Rft-1-domain-containing protein [Trametes versicolor FP-101664 SS1]EIW61017.1 Rft-1-domain-containing protein [Trametes versicolor FP-101664 SS1]